MISNMIREFFKLHPEGGYTDDIMEFCNSRGVYSKAKDERKSFSGILSKMRDRGEITYKKDGNKYWWKPKK